MATEWKEAIREVHDAKELDISSKDVYLLKAVANTMSCKDLDALPKFKHLLRLQNEDWLNQLQEDLLVIPATEWIEVFRAYEVTGTSDLDLMHKYWDGFREVQHVPNGAPQASPERLLRQTRSTWEKLLAACTYTLDTSYRPSVLLALDRLVKDVHTRHPHLVLQTWHIPQPVRSPPDGIWAVLRRIPGYTRINRITGTSMESEPTRLLGLQMPVHVQYWVTHRGNQYFTIKEVITDSQSGGVLQVDMWATQSRHPGSRSPSPPLASDSLFLPTARAWWEAFLQGK